MPLFIFLLWILLNGRITLEIVLFGLGITAVLTWAAVRATNYSLRNDLRIIKNLPLCLLYGLNLVFEIIKAAVTVMVMVYRADDPDPVIIEFHSGLRSKVQNVLLANSITLTPGTITVFQEGDRFVVHALRKEYAEGIEDSSFIRLLRKMK